MQVLDRLQGIIERTYDLENTHRVGEFLVTCPDFARSYGLEPGSPRGVERVLVDERAVDLGLSVYLDASVVDRLAEQDPLSSLHDGNLDAFWTALEGVSHFVYLVWNARRSKPVTRLELEPGLHDLQLLLDGSFRPEASPSWQQIQLEAGETVVFGLHWPESYSTLGGGYQ